MKQREGDQFPCTITGKQSQNVGRKWNTSSCPARRTGTRLIWFWTGANGGSKKNCQWTFGFHKKLVTFWGWKRFIILASRIVATQTSRRPPHPALPFPPKRASSQTSQQLTAPPHVSWLWLQCEGFGSNTVSLCRSALPTGGRLGTEQVGSARSW